MKKWPFGLTEELWNLADSTENIYPPLEYQIDWGTPKRQGKRVKGCVIGGMADPPKGIKTYISILGNAPVTKEEQKDFISLEYDYNKEKYLKARSAGIEHSASMVYALFESKKDFMEKLASEYAEWSFEDREALEWLNANHI